MTAPDLHVTIGAHEASLIARLDRGDSVADVLDDHLSWLENRSGKFLASVLLVADDGEHLRHGAAPSLPAEYNAVVDGIAIGPNIGSCGTAAYCGHAIYVADIATDPLWRDYKELALAHGLRACWSAPVRVGDRVVGTFATYYRQRHAPGIEDRALIEQAADTVARLLLHARQRPD